MVKNTYSIPVSDLDFSTDSSLQIRESVELESDEAEMYSLLFNEEIGAPIEVKKPLQRCLRRFVDNGLLEKEYHRFVKLCHQAIENNFDSVEKDGLQVINNQSDVSLICGDKRGDWEVVCTLERGLISKFYKNKNFGGGKIIGRAISDSTTTQTTTTVPISIGWTATGGKYKDP